MESVPNPANRDTSERILDVRPESDFLPRHRAGAVNIPLEELTQRLHELPPKVQHLTVFDANPVRARWARSRLRARERQNIEVASGEAWLAAGVTEAGPSRGRLWEPHGLLREAVELARESWGSVSGKGALDIACGAGRDAVVLALAGFDVEAWDVLPDALERCGDLARRSGVVISTALRDVERNPSIARSAYDLICCFNFLHRPLMTVIAEAVRPGGFVVYETFLEQQRVLFGKPRRNAHLLKAGELAGFFTGWDVLVSREGLAGPRRYVASLVALNPQTAR